jgi:hypothetical protein
MKFSITKYAIVAVLFTATLSSCEKYLDRKPLSSISQDDFYNNAQQVQAALTGVYNSIGARTISPGFNNPTPYYVRMDAFTELGIERNLTGTIGSGTYTAGDGTTAELWAGFYQVVQRANNLLFYMSRAQGTMSAAEYNRVIAEAKTLRAMAYWYLVTYFGDVPYFTTPSSDPANLSNVTRTNKKVIINALIADLETVYSSLDWMPAQQGRVSRGVAMGIAARLAMVDKNYTLAASITDNIIANGGYNLNPVFQNLFRKAAQNINAGNEIMFIYPYGDTDIGSFNYLNLTLGSRNQGGQSSLFPSQFLVDLFECRDGKNIATSPLYNPAKPNQSRDPRMAQTVVVPGDTLLIQPGLGFNSIVFNFFDRTQAIYNTTTSAITFPSTAVNQDSANIFGPRVNGLGNLVKKYLQDRDVNGTAGNLYRVGWIYMRFAEILLINAEAKLESGQPLSGVVTQINRVRTRAGMPMVDATTAGNITLLRQLVRREKTLELAFEGLHLPDMRRWDDGAYARLVMPLQLYGQANSRMTLVPGVGLVFNTPAPPPVFDATYAVPVSWPSGDALRLKREQRIFNSPQHLLNPIPQGERDRMPSLTQNPGWQ